MNCYIIPNNVHERLLFTLLAKLNILSLEKNNKWEILKSKIKENIEQQIIIILHNSFKEDYDIFL